MFEHYRSYFKIKGGTEKSFGLVFAAVFTIIGFYPLWYDENIRLWACIIAFIFLYFFIFFILAAFLSLNGLDFITALSGSASAISNVEPGLGEVIGPNGNFSNLPNFSKLSLSLGMLLGRLELFAVLVLFFPSFWKN